MGIDETLDLAFNYQRGKLAVFLINYYSYGGWGSWSWWLPLS